MDERIPEYQDTVKNKNNEATGIVIAKYRLDGETYLDVRSFEDKIYYKTPIDNWSAVSTEEERI